MGIKGASVGWGGPKIDPPPPSPAYWLSHRIWAPPIPWNCFMITSHPPHNCWDVGDGGQMFTRYMGSECPPDPPTFLDALSKVSGRLTSKQSRTASESL